MIVLLTDYSYQGPYVGQLKAKIHQYAPSATVIDLIHDLPAFNTEVAAVLIPAITNNFPDNTIFICVVDPGVGSDRKPVVIKVNSNYYIGPDNGIFSYLDFTNQAIKIWEITWQPTLLSNSFHGRDIFVPIACQLYNKSLNFETDLREFNQLVTIVQTTIKPQLIYFDSFGNAVTSISNNSLAEQDKLKIGDTNISYARVFSDNQIGECFWYVNSMGLVEIACNQSSAKQILGLSIGQSIKIH